jgi:hypothetical protein
MGLHSVMARATMVDNEFRRERAQTVSDLVNKASDHFIKERLLALMGRHDDGATLAFS